MNDLALAWWAESRLTPSLAGAVSLLAASALSLNARPSATPAPARLSRRLRELAEEDERPWYWPSLYEPGSSDDPEGVREALRAMWGETSAAGRREAERALEASLSPEEREWGEAVLEALREEEEGSST